MTIIRRKYRPGERSRFTNRALRRLNTVLCRKLTRHHDPDAADRAQTAMTEAETRRNGSR